MSRQGVLAAIGWTVAALALLYTAEAPSATQDGHGDGRHSSLASFLEPPRPDTPVAQGRPDNALAGGLARVEELLAAGDTVSAREELTALPLRPGDAEGLARLASLAERASLPNLALGVLETIPTEANRVDRIRLASVVGRWARASELLLGLLARAPDVEVRRELAHALRMAGRGPEAAGHYEILVAQGGLDEATADQYAGLLEEMGELARAREIRAAPRARIGGLTVDVGSPGARPAPAAAVPLPTPAEPRAIADLGDRAADPDPSGGGAAARPAAPIIPDVPRRELEAAVTFPADLPWGPIVSRPLRPLRRESVLALAPPFASALPIPTASRRLVSLTRALATRRETAVLRTEAALSAAMQIEPSLQSLAPALAAPELEAHVASALGLDLLAQRTLEAYLDATPAPRRSTASEWALLGEIATKRGDVATARAALKTAEASRIDSADLRPLRQGLRRATRPAVSGGASRLRTGASVEALSAWTDVSVRPWGRGLELHARGYAWEARQAGVGRRIKGAGIGTDSLFLGDAVRVQAGLGGWIEEPGGTPRLRGALSAEIEQNDGSTWKLEVSRGPLLRASASTDPLAAVRVREVARLPRHVSEIEVRASVSIRRFRGGIERRVDLELGAARHSDGNGRVQGFGRVRVPLLSGRPISLALEPNAYAEVFRFPVPGFLAHGGYVGVGLGAHVTMTVGGLRLALSGNPHVFQFLEPHFVGSASLAGIGIEADARLELPLGPVLIDLRGSLLDQGLHRSVRADAGARLRIG